MPESQADVQAELMAESFAMIAEKILTREHFEVVLKARFAEQDARFENRFVKLEKTLFLHTWMLGLVVLVLVVPQLQAWLA